MEQTTTRTLPVKLTDEELAAMAARLADAELLRVERTTELESEIEEWTELESEIEEWKEHKKSLENAEAYAVALCVRLSRVVKFREEPREVECEVKVENGQYYVVRKDTGEVVMQRAASAEELQGKLFEDAGGIVDKAIENAKEAARGDDQPLQSER